ADVPHGRIFRVTPDFGSWSQIIKYDGKPHGLAVTQDGDLLIADYRKGILRFNLESKAFEVLCAQYNTENFRGLSDLVSDPDGNIWFTDSGRSSLSDPTGRLFKLTPDGTVTCVLDNIPYPNGVEISADGAHVFVAATRANAVWRLLRNPPEKGQPMVGIYIQLSGGLGPDGLAVSAQGELAVAHAQSGSVWLFDKFGDPIARVRTPSGLWTTSVCFDRFGSAAGRTLFMIDAQTGSLFAHDLG